MNDKIECSCGGFVHVQYGRVDKYIHCILICSKCFRVMIDNYCYLTEERAREEAIRQWDAEKMGRREANAKGG